MEVVVLLATLIVFIIALRKLPDKLQVAVIAIMIALFLALLLFSHYYPVQTVRFIESIGIINS